ncbi:MAG TPA: phage major capsid protein [Actinomycetes bacterium]|nr:phage major capsid protein [Actinomycetes bacterium]
MTLAELQAERAKLVAQMRAINDAAKKENRSFNTEEDSSYQKLEEQVDKLTEQIATEEKTSARASKLLSLEDALKKAPAPTTKPTPGAPGSERSSSYLASDEYRQLFEAYLTGGRMALAEHRVDTLQVGLFTKGGALVGPEQFVAELIKKVDDAVFVRSRPTRKFRITTSMSLGVPTLDTDIDDADWTAELLTGNQGDISVGKRELRPHPLAKRCKVSKTLDRISAIPVTQLVLERLAYKFGVTDEKGFLTGNGVQKPLGIFTASADGVPTSQDVSTDNTTTAITADGLIEAKHFMKAAYWPSASWVFHRDAIKMIRKLKDGNGQYLWQPGIGGGGAPNTILDLPYDISEFAPNTFTTGQYVGALAAWPWYWIVDALDLTVQFLDQLYAESNQNGYIGRKETDGAPVLAEAFVRVKLA